MNGSFKGEGLDRKYLCNSKAFLQPKRWDEGGSIQWYVAGKAEKGGVLLGGEIQISDCLKHVYLDFDCTSQEEYLERVDKVGVLIKELEEFRSALSEARRHALELHKENEEKGLFKEEGTGNVRDCHCDDGVDSSVLRGDSGWR